MKAVGKERPRWCFKHQYAYTPKKTKEFEEKFSQFVVLYMKQNQMKITDGPVAINIVVYKKVPKSWSKKKKEAALNKEIRPIVKPDNDNIEKIIWDSLENTLYTNDSVIVDNVCRKFYGEKNIIHLSIKYLPINDHYKLEYPVVNKKTCSCNLCIFT